MCTDWPSRSWRLWRCKVEEPAPTALGEDWNPTGDSQPRLLKLAAGLGVGSRNPREGGRGGLSTSGG